MGFMRKKTWNGNFSIEGLKVLQPKENRDMYIIDQYKKHLFDFSKLNISVIPGNQLIEKMNDVMKKRQSLKIP